MEEGAAAAAAEGTQAAGTTEAATALAGGETKPAEVAKVEGEKGKESDGKQADKSQTDNKDGKSQAPESYQLKLPEGTVTDPALLDEFSILAKEKGFTNEDAQKFVDLQLKSLGVFAQKQAEEFQAQVKGWRDELINDKDIGGAKVDQTVNQARKVLNIEVPGVKMDRLKADLDRTGLGDHPDLIRVFAFIGQFVGDDNKIISDRVGGPAGGPKTDAEVLYPEHKP
jgi:hypothetical protein